MITCENLVKIYKTGELEVVALQGLDLQVDDGELMAIIGNSGSGKSTLLNMLGALDRPSAGILRIDGHDLLKMNKRDIVRYKRETVGFVWQNNARNLIPYLSAVENIEVPMLIKGAGKRRRHAMELLEMVGLVHRAKHPLSQLSGGEQQRVAIAIAIANSPRLLLADEPTGSVDTHTMQLVLDVFRKINRDLGMTVVIVTHDHQLSRLVDRIVAIRDGRTSSEFIRASYADELAELEKSQNAAIAGVSETHRELAVLDNAGRLQIPRDLLDKLGVKGKARMQIAMEDDAIVIRQPEEEAPQA